jgi:short subunit fatty acids transporter
VKFNDLAILAMIGAVVLWPVGLVLGVIARREIARTAQRGELLAVAAVIVSGIIGVVTAFLLLISVVSIANDCHGRIIEETHGAYASQNFAPRNYTVFSSCIAPQGDFYRIAQPALSRPVPVTSPVTPPPVISSQPNGSF